MFTLKADLIVEGKIFKVACLDTESPPQGRKFFFITARRSRGYDKLELEKRGRVT